PRELRRPSGAIPRAARRSLCGPARSNKTCYHRCRASWRLRRLGDCSTLTSFMSTESFRLRYIAKAAAGVPRDLYNTFVSAVVHPIRPTVLIYNCTFVCDARCEMCHNWQHGDRKSDMTLEQLDGVMAHDFWGAVENLNISGGEPTTRNDLPEMVELFVRRLPRVR